MLKIFRFHAVFCQEALNYYWTLLFLMTDFFVFFSNSAHAGQGWHIGHVRYEISVQILEPV